MLNISHLHFLKVLKASSALFLTEAEGTGLKRSLIPCTLEADRKGWCFILRSRDSSSIWHLETHMWFAVSQSQPAAFEMPFAHPVPGSGRLPPPALLLLRCLMSGTWVCRALHSHTGRLVQHQPARQLGFYSEDRGMEQGEIEMVFSNFQCS